MFGRKPREQRDKNRPCALCPAVVPESQMLAINRGRTTYFVEWSHIEALLLDPNVHARLVRLWPEISPHLKTRMPAWFSPPASRAEVDLTPLQNAIHQAGMEMAPTLEKIRGALEELRAGVAEVARLAAAPPSREQMDVIRGMLDAHLGREDRPGVLRHMEILEGQDALLAEIHTLRRTVENGDGRRPQTTPPTDDERFFSRLKASQTASPAAKEEGFHPIDVHEEAPPPPPPAPAPMATPPPVPPAEKIANPNPPLGPRGWEAVETLLRSAGAPGLTYTQMVLRGLDPEDLRRTLTNYRERLESLRAGGHILYSLRDNTGDKGDNGTAPSPRRGAAVGSRRGRG